MGLYQNMLKDPVRQLSLRTPVMSTPEEKIGTCIQRMQRQKLGCVIVVDDQQEPIGMFTEGMIAQSLADDSLDLNEPIKVRMATQWPWVRDSDPIADVLEAMQAKNVRFICVVDDQGRVAGLTGQKGLMEYVADHYPGQVMVQRVGATPYSKREGA